MRYLQKWLFISFYKKKQNYSIFLWKKLTHMWVWVFRRKFLFWGMSEFAWFLLSLDFLRRANSKGIVNWISPDTQIVSLFLFVYMRDSDSKIAVWISAKLLIVRVKPKKFLIRVKFNSVSSYAYKINLWKMQEMRRLQRIYDT